MMDAPFSDIIGAHPIGPGLDAFRSTVPPLLRQQLACAEECNEGKLHTSPHLA